jgi:MarR family transcriptional regulator, organic hydroperoxide resistance regulator
VLKQMRRVTRSVQAVLADSAARVGLSENDFQAMVRVVAGGGLRGAELGRIMGMTSSSITELADRLEHAGLVARTRSNADRRVVVLRATARGSRLVNRALGPVLSAMGAVLDGLDHDELAVVGNFLDLVEHGLLGVADR